MPRCEGRWAACQYVNAGGRRGALTADAEQRADALDGYGELWLFPVANFALIGGGQFTYGRREVSNRLDATRNARRSYDEWSPRIGAL